MKPKSIVLILLTTIINFNLTVSQSSDFGIYKCKNNTNTNVFKQDITKSLTSLTGHVASHGGFYNSTASTRVTSTALCRGDIGPDECEKCVKTAIPSLLRNCPNHAEAAAWYSDCIVRFSHGEIVGVLDTWTFDKLYNSASVDKGEVSEFSEALSELTVKLTALAANGGSVRKLGFGNVTVVGSGLVRTIYAMMQCTPDLSKEMCRKCLFNASEEIGKCCRGRVAARVFYPNCFLRYSNEHFYNDPPLISSSGEAKSGKKNNTTRTIYVVVPVICGSLGLIVIGVLLYLMKKRRNGSLSKEKTTSFSSLLDEQKQTSMKDAAGMEIATVQNLQYDLKTIEVATNCFSPKNTIGKGGFGLVYKGVLPNGQEVAVKRLSETSGQGVQEFVNEAVLVAKLQHRNLVRLLGFCHESKEKILIYEYVPNKSLDYFLFNSVKHGHLDWAKRWKIIGGVTRGMLYLHEDSRLRIIHRDLKASNILLDQDMNAKISDFGLARIFGVDQTLGNTNKIAGTL
ncbi:gnk2-like domain-containing protein [Artemisia annua]|nr:gnk2-like domain-containing protein [Artemisia annua]